jgi:hypothetical protein
VVKVHPLPKQEQKVEQKPPSKVVSVPQAEQRKPPPETDYALLLIDLAEEYFDAAYGKSTEEEAAKREPDPNTFYKLVATGLSCLEVVLKVSYHLKPTWTLTNNISNGDLLFSLL